MKSARQVLRWGIPGWSFLVFWVLFAAIRSLCDGSFSNWLTGVLELEPTVAVAAFAIPAGFLIYQLYWRIHWWDFPGNIVHRDKGYEVLKDADIDFEFLVGTSLDTTSTKAEGRKFFFPFLVLHFLEDKPPDIVRRYQQNWYLADFTWYDTIRRHKLEFLEQRATFLGDIYHSLGAARTSLMIITSCYFIYDLRMIGKLLHFFDGCWQEYLRLHGFPLAINLVVASAIFFILSFSREDTLQDLIALKHHVITCLHELPKIQNAATGAGTGIPA